MGNRLTKNDSVDGLTTYAYDSNDRLLSETTNGVTTTYTYDANGNLLSEVSSEQQVVYTWSDENRLVGATTTTAAGTQQVEYVYDADGVRVAKTVDGEETRYLIDANRQYAQVLEEYDATTGTEVAYVYGNELISQTRGTENDFYLTDGHSGVRQLTDETGGVTDSYLYDAYGNVLKRIGDTDNDYLYRGEQTDSKTGLQYLRARYNDTEAGRFISTDPFEGMIEMPVSRHRYLYGNDNPIMYSDPSGLITMGDITAKFALDSILESLTLVGLTFAPAQFIGSQLAGIDSNSIAWSGIKVSGSGGKSRLLLSTGLGADIYATTSSSGNGESYSSKLGLILAIHANYGLSTPPLFGQSNGPIGSVGTFEVRTPASFGHSIYALGGGYFEIGLSVSAGLESIGGGATYGRDFMIMGYGRGSSSNFGVNVGGFGASVGISLGISIPLFEIEKLTLPTPDSSSPKGY